MFNRGLHYPYDWQSVETLKITSNISFVEVPHELGGPVCKFTGMTFIV